MSFKRILRFQGKIKIYCEMTGDKKQLFRERFNLYRISKMIKQ